MSAVIPTAVFMFVGILGGVVFVGNSTRSCCLYEEDIIQPPDDESMMANEVESIGDDSMVEDESLGVDYESDESYEDLEDERFHNIELNE